MSNVVKLRPAPQIDQFRKCTDCIYIRRDKEYFWLMMVPPWIFPIWLYRNSVRFAKCVHPKSYKPEPDVSELVGTSQMRKSSMKDYHFCATSRTFDYLCGEKAQWFQPTEPPRNLWDRLVALFR